jgi:hypothetical protein
MSETPVMPDPAVPADARPPRSSGAVLAILGAIIAVPLLVLVAFLCLRGGVGGGNGGGDDVLDGIRTNRVQSVDLTNGRLYYGHLRDAHGDWVQLEDAYFIRRGATTGKDAASASPELVRLKDEQGGDGDLSLNTREIVSVQDLAADSQIGSTIDDDTKK